MVQPTPKRSSRSPSSNGRRHISTMEGKGRCLHPGSICRSLDLGPRQTRPLGSDGDISKF